jgi:hypothetical protein
MRSLTFSLLLWTCAACGSSAPSRGPAPTGPIALDGLTVTAPPGEGWQLVESKPDAVVFERREANGAVLKAMAGIFPFAFEDLEECRASLHRDSYVETETQRAPTGSVKIVVDAEPPYVLVRYGAEEADGLGADATWHTVTTEIRWFLRPTDRRGVMLSFHERRPLGQKPAEYGAQAALFFGSLRFE